MATAKSNTVIKEIITPGVTPVLSDAEAKDRASRQAGFIRTRDFNIWAAEQINAPIPLTVQPVASDGSSDELPSLRASDDGCPKREVLDAPRSSDGLNVVTTQEEKA